MRRRHLIEREREQPARLRPVSAYRLRQAAHMPPSPTEGTYGLPGRQPR